MIDDLCNELLLIAWNSEPKNAQTITKAVLLLKKQSSMLGIQQTSDSITFISTGTAQQGEARGIMLGKAQMHEWLKVELLRRGLLTDEIRSVFNEAKQV